MARNDASYDEINLVEDANNPMPYISGEIKLITQLITINKLLSLLQNNCQVFNILEYLLI